MKSIWMAAVSILVGLLAAGLLELTSRPPRGAAIQLLPPPTPPPIRVHVSGAVAHPGVVALPPGSRVEDAIQAAGGLSDQARADDLNLAALLQDGEKIYVASRPGTAPAQGNQASPLNISNRQATDAATLLININTATSEELEQLPGIGPATAAKIIAYREENGVFQAIEEIQNVSGIGPVTFEKIKPYITVEGP